MLEPRDHVVERRGQEEQLVTVAKPRRRDLQALAVVASRGDVAGGGGDVRDRAEGAPRQQIADHDGQQQGADASRQQQALDGGHRVLERRQRFPHLDCSDNLVGAGLMQWHGQQTHVGIAGRDRCAIEDVLVLLDRLTARVGHRQLTASQIGRRRDHPSTRIQELDVDARFGELAQGRLELPRRDVLGLQEAAEPGADLAADLIGAQRQALVHAARQALLEGEVQQRAEGEQGQRQQHAVPERQPRAQRNAETQHAAHPRSA